MSGAADLPDPVENPGSDTGTNADDLLAQMAGDEIDRLLADADVATKDSSGQPSEAGQEAIEALQAASATTAAGPAAAAAASTEDVDAVTARQLDELMKELQSSSGQPAGDVAAMAAPTAAPGDGAKVGRMHARATSGAAAAQDLEESLSTELEDLYQQLSADTEARPAPSASGSGNTASPAQRNAGSESAAAAAAALAVDEAVKETTSHASSDGHIAMRADASQATASPNPGQGATVDPAEQTGALERRVLAAELLTSATQSQDAAERVPDPDRVPLHVRMLMWINKPIDGCSDYVRGLIGKAAVVTLVNAILLIGYVLIFRRK